jgi:hypothetical protein
MLPPWNRDVSDVQQARPQAEEPCHEPSRPASLHRSHPALLKRTDITGARWGLEGAEAILKLRAVIASGDLDDYWSFHLRREPARTHPPCEIPRWTRPHSLTRSPQRSRTQDRMIPQSNVAAIGLTPYQVMRSGRRERKWRW